MGGAGRLFFVLGLLSSFLFAAPRGALAQDAAASDADARARTHFESGRLHFDEGDYEAALSEFTSAYELSHRDGLLFNLYLAHERLGHLVEAADHLERFLATDLVPAEERDTLTRRLAHLRERIAAGATEIDESDEAPPPPTAPSSNEHPLLVPGIVTLVAGGVGLVLFAGLGGAALGEDSSLASRCGSGAGRTCTEADVSTLRALSLGADVSLGIGAAAAVAGAVLLIVDATSGGSASAEAHASVAPFVTSESVGVLVGGTL